MYEEETANINRLSHQVEYGLRSAKTDAEDLSPIFRLIDEIINLGLVLRASDVHIMPLSDKARLRYRIDGALFMPDINISTSVLNQMVARIKVLAHIKAAAVGTALDGHIAHNFNGRQIDIRVAIMPVKFGESVVLRIMNAERNLKTIEEKIMFYSKKNRYKDLRISKKICIFALDFNH